MGAEMRAVIDSGPLIHLKEIGAQKALSVFTLTIPPAVAEEVRNIPPRIMVSGNFNNDLVQILQNEFELGLAESQCIALAKAENMTLLLTDDLDARTVAREMSLEPHGTVGILLKAYRKKVFPKKDAIGFVNKLKAHSSLYITSDIIEYIRSEIMKT